MRSTSEASSGPNSNGGGLSAHQMMMTAESATKPPAGTPATSEASKIAGTKGAKSSSIPKDASTARIATAIAMPTKATSNAWGAQGFNRSQYSERSSTVSFPRNQLLAG